MILAVWIGPGHFDPVLREVGDACAANLSSGNVLRQKHTRSLDEATLNRWYAAWKAWYAHEEDVRSYENGTGWIHTVAHGADFAREWVLYQGVAPR